MLAPKTNLEPSKASERQVTRCGNNDKMKYCVLLYEDDMDLVVVKPAFSNKVARYEGDNDKVLKAAYGVLRSLVPRGMRWWSVTNLGVKPCRETRKTLVCVV